MRKTRRIATQRENDSQTLAYIEAIIDQVQDAVITTDPSYIIQTWNKAAEDVYGWKANEVIGKNSREILQTEYPEYKGARPSTEEIFKKGHWKGVVIQKRKNGTKVHIMASATLIKDKKRNIIGAIAINRDITKQQSAEADQARLAAIISSSSDAIVGKTLEGVIFSWNKGAEKTFGYTAKEAVGKHISIIIPLELLAEEEMILSRIRQGQYMEHYETIRQRKDGTKVNVSLSVSPIKNKNGEIIGASKIARDITEKKEFEQRKDDFISMASHELKTPVTSIKLFNQTLLKRLQKEGNSTVVNHLQKMEIQIDKMTRLVKELLDVSRIQAGKLQVVHQPFDIRELVEEILSSFHLTNPEFSFVVNNTAKKYTVSGDRDRIGQVLINLYTNGIKYSQKKQEIVTSVSNDKESITVSVQDFGIGIDKKHHDKIFDRFYQVTELTAKTYPGLGMGLYISNEIIRLHGGSMWLKSQKGKGSMFFFKLPIFSKKV